MNIMNYTGLTISCYGARRYWKNDQLHRLNGPAVIYNCSSVLFIHQWWYYYNQCIECNNNEEFQRYIKLMVLI